MSLKIEYHDTEVEIAGHRFSMHQSHHIQDHCQKVIELRVQLRQEESEASSDVIAELSDVYSDGVFSKLSPADLSDAELIAIVSGLDKGGHVNPDEVYTPYVDDGDIEVSSRARLALSLKTELSTVGVHLRWPAPPFNDDFDLQLEEELRFQLGWSMKLLELSGELSKDERLTLSLPLSPYSESSVTVYVGAHKRIVSERGLWAKLGFGQGLSEAGEKRWKALKGIQSAHELGISCVEVSDGRFMMGALPSDVVSADDEKPRHEVVISSAMVVMKYPITQKVYEGVMGSNPSHFKGGFKPVELVNWYDAVKFANVLSRRYGLSEAYRIDGEDVACDWNSDGWRLPTEAEWEYLARGGEEHLYAGSGDIDAVSWYNGNSRRETHPVGQKQGNGFGLYDMTGNVWEWCWDWKGDYSRRSVTDPRGTWSGSNRVYRGGSYCSTASLARASCRRDRGPYSRIHNVGFRLLRIL